MTPTEQWIMDLALVYSVPAFISGVGITLLFVRWRDVHPAVAMVPRFLSAKMTLERRGSKAVAPADQIRS